MRPLFNHSLLTSFALFLDNNLMNGAQAYVNVSTGLYSQQGQSVTGYVWASPYKSWVYDSCVTGAIIPTLSSGFYNNSGQLLTRASGIVVDFQNGRVLSSKNWGPVLSGSFARKEYNIYISTTALVDFYLEKNFGNNIDLAYSLTGTLASRYSAPCIFLTNANEHNEPFALGGLDETNNTIRAYIISNNIYQQEGVNSYVRDLAKSYFSLVNYGDWPLGGSGDLKNLTGFCYSNLCSQYGVAGVFIENVHNVRVNQKTISDTQMIISLVEFDCQTLRLPRQSK